MKLKSIIVPKNFLTTMPRQAKLDAITKYYKKHGTLDKPITVNKNGVLLDGYARYIVANTVKMEDVPVVIKPENSIYVAAVHSRKSKRYWWKVKKSDEKGFVNKVHIGSKILVDTKKGNVDAYVVDIKVLEEPPIDNMIKYVVEY